MTTNIHFHLGNVQKELNAPKNRRNSFGNYNYRNCEDIVEAVKKVMLAGCHVTLSDNIEMVGDRIYVKAVATFSFGNEQVSVQAFARESCEKKGMDAAQITGAASSYARKYALNGLFAIDDSKDIDEEESKPRPHAQEYKKAANCPPVNENGVDVSSLHKTFINIKEEKNTLAGIEFWKERKTEEKSALWNIMTEKEKTWMKDILNKDKPPREARV